MARREDELREERDRLRAHVDAAGILLKDLRRAVASGRVFRDPDLINQHLNVLFEVLNEVNLEASPAEEQRPTPLPMRPMMNRERMEL